MAPMNPKALPEQDPGGKSLTLTTPNPRRSPASSREVNVLHDGRKRQRLSLSPEKHSQVQKAQEIVDELPWVLTSQASGSSDQSGSKWFNAASKNIDPGQRHASELDDDPPFYLSNHSNYIPANFVASENGRPFGGQSRLDSENEDLRGVIDDLTVENKRLKHIIRRQQRQSRSTPSEASQQQPDKLFEVRMHALPSDKRRELEDLLTSFATSVHTSVPSKRGSPSNGSASITSSGRNDNGKDMPKTDSGYASNTTSAGNSRLATVGSVASKSLTSKAVKSYLQDIPDALLPKRSPIMSERTKQALVVRRLEQLFTGRKAAPGEHNHPMQQQEISQSAAKADRAQDARDNRKRKAEGTREAHVMPPNSKVNLDAMDSPELKGRPIEKAQADASIVDTLSTSRPGSPDQRPTRPLDLDFHRAQAAAENFQYIHHLGLSCPQLNGTPKDGEESPWIFLNLLASLAQLHTLNVTPKFIRRAIRKLSKRFELSKDGHKVRWVGGNEGTEFNAGDEKAVEVADISPQESTEGVRTAGSGKRSKTNSTSNAAVTSNTPSDEQTSGLQTSSDSKQHQATISGTSDLNTTSIPTKATTQSSAFDYRPIVFREKARIEDEEFRSSEESLDSHSGDSSGLVPTLSRSNLKQQNKGEGPITFYNNPYFCSDFSSEPESSNMLPPRPIVVGETLGIAIPAATCESPLRHHDATYFTMQFAPKPFDPEALSDEGKARFESSLPKLPLSPMGKTEEQEMVPMEMEICGLGGVTPEDNFALDVKYEVAPASSRDDGVVARQLPFSRRKCLHKYISKIISCHKVDLLPSKLPPPSYIFFTSSSSSDAADPDDVSESSGSSSSPFVDEEYPAPPAFLRQFSSSSAENMGDDEDEGMDSSEIDRLAIARQIKPEQITEQEPVYMMNRPGYLPRVAAGSLAATVGASRSNSSRHGVAGASSSISNVSMESQDDDEDEEEEMDEE